MRYAAIAAFAVLATAAPAQGAVTSYSLHAGPLTVHGYQMTVDASHGSVDVTFDRSVQGMDQSHTYHFDRVHLTGSRNLRTGRLTGDLGAFGSIDLRFRRSGAIHKRKLAPQCFGEKDRHRVGRLTGTFRLVADSTFFGTVVASRLPGELTRSGLSICRATGTAPEFPGPLTLALDGPADTSFTVIALSRGRSFQQISVDDGHVLHEIASTGAAGSFTGSTQALTVLGPAPGFSGTLAYRATKRSDKFDTTGTLSGDYTALFDSIAPVSFPAGTKAQVSGPS